MLFCFPSDPLRVSKFGARTFARRDVYSRRREEDRQMDLAPGLINNSRVHAITLRIASVNLQLMELVIERLFRHSQFRAGFGDIPVVPPQHILDQHAFEMRKLFRERAAFASLSAGR